MGVRLSRCRRVLNFLQERLEEARLGRGLRVDAGRHLGTGRSRRLPVLRCQNGEILGPTGPRAFELPLRLGRFGRWGHGRLFSFPRRAGVIFNLPSPLKGIPRPHLLQGFGLRSRFPGGTGPRRTGGFDVEQSGGVPKTVRRSLSLRHLKAPLPGTELPLVCLLPALLLPNTLRGPVVIEGEIQVDVQMVPDGLPHASPMKGVQLAAVLHPPLLRPSATSPSFLGASRTVGGEGSRAGGPLGLTPSAVPRPRRYLVEVHAVGMVRGIAPIAEQEQLLIIGIATDGTRLIFGEIILNELHDHRGIDLGHLDSVLHGIGRKDGAYHNSQLANDSMQISL